MKKVFLICLFTLLSVFSVYADSFSYNGVLYEVVSESSKTCTVFGIHGNNGSDVIIPSTAVWSGKVIYENDKPIKRDVSYTVVSITHASNRGLVSITLPETVVSIGEKAFYELPNLTTVNFPASLKSIGAQAFEYCRSLRNATLPHNVSYIGREAFNSTDLREIHVPNSVTTIERGAYAGCENLITATFSASVSRLENAMFSQCKSLTTVNLTHSITEIGDGAFAQCDKLANIDLPASLSQIGRQAFLGCFALKSIDIPGGVYKVGDEAFMSCRSLKDVTLREGISVIGESAFEFCFSLRSLHLPSTVKTIEKGAFWSCTSLSTLDLSDNLETIGMRAFRDCSALQYLQIPLNVQLIDEEAFSRCDALSTVRCLSPVPCTLRSYNFSYVEKIIVPDGSVPAYKSADKWKNFWCIVSESENGSGVEEIVSPSGSSNIPIYDLSGRPVVPHDPGIYIINGVKTFIPRNACIPK